MIRILSCLLLFGLGAEALGGGSFGVVVSGLIAFAANRAWRQQNEADRRAQLIADEELRLAVRERQAQP